MARAEHRADRRPRLAALAAAGPRPELARRYLEEAAAVIAARATLSG